MASRRKTVQRDPLGRVQSEFEEEENEDSAFDRRGLLTRRAQHESELIYA